MFTKTTEIPFLSSQIGKYFKILRELCTLPVSLQGQTLSSCRAGGSKSRLPLGGHLDRSHRTHLHLSFDPAIPLLEICPEDTPPEDEHTYEQEPSLQPICTCKTPETNTGHTPEGLA